MVKRRGPPSQGWLTFLRNHAPDIAATDSFVVPTIGFDLLYAFVVVRLDRRDLVWINVTRNPTAEWVARQITEAFPWDDAPKYLVRDRDQIYDAVVTRRLRAMGIRDKSIAPASPWQNGFAERLIGRSAASAWIISSFLVRPIYAGSRDPTHAITTTSERIGHWTKTRRPFARFSGLESSVHTRYSAGFIITTSGFRFSVHTVMRGSRTARSCKSAECHRHSEHSLSSCGNDCHPNSSRS